MPNSRNNKLSVILDGMSGKYFVIGKVLQEADHDEGDGIEMRELTVFDSMREEVVKDFKEVFNIDGADPKLFAFTHFS